jgi:hypothetical protein
MGRRRRLPDGPGGAYPGSVRRVVLLPALALLLSACSGSGSSVTSTGAAPQARDSDLTVAGVTFDPVAPVAGEPVTATVQWVDLAAVEPFAVPITIDLMLQPETLGLVCTWESRLALGTVTCEFAGWAEPGTYRWDAWVDTLKVIEEPNEGNNTLGGSITVGG